MLLSEFKSKLENLIQSNGLSFEVFKSDVGVEWYAIRLSSRLLEVITHLNGEIGINLPTEDDEMSFGGSDEAYDDFEKAFERVRGIVDESLRGWIGLPY